MQTTTDRFLARSQQAMRPLAWMCRMSFTKQFDTNIDFFTVGSSTIGGTDIIKGVSSDVVQEWDKYEYTDYTSRILDINITRQVEPISSVTMSMADIVLNNYDDYFTTGKGSEIDGYILPYRPVRLYLGFGNEVIPMFIGITEKMPVIDEANKTATFHCIDFMYTLMNKSLDESIIEVDARVDEIMVDLFDLVGITSSQLDLDGAFTTVPYAYFEKGSKLGGALNELLEAEGGRLYMNELGVITFRNRQNYNTTSVFDFNSYDNIIDINTRPVDEVINVVQVKGKIRQLQAKQKYWELDSAIEVPAGESVEIWADFEDPVTSVDTPVYITGASTSLFTVNSQSDGSGENDSTHVTLTASSLFAQSYKMTFANSDSRTLYITTLELFATPVKTISNLYVRDSDSTSVAAYDERVYEIENDFFQSEEQAEVKAAEIIRDYKDYGIINEMEVKGNPALQIDDTVTVTVKGVSDTYKITKVIDGISFPAYYKQVIKLKKFTPTIYFTIESSEIGGEDLIHP